MNNQIKILFFKKITIINLNDILLYFLGGAKLNYKHIFGPIPSRRLGLSLGVDMVPLKICNLDCVYCECGKTVKKTNKRDRYIDPDEILNELDDILSGKPTIDYITLTGSGEPTLSIDLGYIINSIKKKHPDYKIAVLTNSVLLTDPIVRNELLDVSVVLPSIDGVSDEVFFKIDKPEEGIEIKSIIDGLIEFRKLFSGQIWIELFVIHGINDMKSELYKFKEVFTLINPDRIQLNSLDRPGVESWVRESDYSDLLLIKDYFYPLTVDIVGRFKTNIESTNDNSNLIDRIVNALKRRPCTLDDLSIITGAEKQIIINALKTQIDSGLIIIEKLSRGDFYKFVF